MGALDGIVQAIGDFLTPQPLWFGRDGGFEHFSGAHLAWLAFCLALVVALTSWHTALSRAHDERGSAACGRLLFVTAVVPLALLTLHSALMAHEGAFTVEWWPLHLCNVCELLALLFALRGDDLTGTSLVGLGVPASVLALLFPGWTVAPAWSLPSVCGFLEHALVLAAALMVVTGEGELGRRAKAAPTIALLAAYVALVYPLNRAFGTNFAFVAQPIAGTPLSAWAETLGNPGYLVPYALVFSALVWGILALWRLLSTRRNGRGER